MTENVDVDVVVVGGGPAGSTTGHLLAAHGHSVLIVDKDCFPRFHIGESLLPCDLPLFQRLGLDMSLGPFLHKQGAEFIDEKSGDFAFYDFADALPGGPKHAYQVERAAFDHALLRLAERAGATVQLETRVQDIACDEQEARVTTDREVIRARFVVDASGQDAFLGRRAKVLEPLKGLGRGAVFCHFSEIDPAIHGELTHLGNIKVLIRPDGWGWMIPLTQRRISVGFVSNVRAFDPNAPAALLDEILADSPLLQRLTQGATRSETRIARNFSYKNRAAAGLRHACVGDAACFLDPVFSSGVSLAMLGGEQLADTLDRALLAGAESDPSALAGFDQHMQHAYRSVGSLVHSFYNTHLVRNIFFSKTQDPELRSGLISILAGDVWRSDNRFQEMLMRSSRRQMPQAL
jgi:flavin-dependent dehydrogenase